MEMLTFPYSTTIGAHYYDHLFIHSSIQLSLGMTFGLYAATLSLLDDRNIYLMLILSGTFIGVMVYLSYHPS